MTDRAHARLRGDGNQTTLLLYNHIFVHEKTNDTGNISKFSTDDQTRLLQYETPDSPFVVLRPNDQHVRDGGVGDPRFRPRQCVGAVFALLRSGPHAARVGTRTRFGQAEATNQLSGSECWQILTPVRE